MAGEVSDRVLHNWYGEVSASGATTSNTVIKSSQGKYYGMVVTAATASTISVKVFDATTTGQTTGVIDEIYMVSKADTTERSSMIPPITCSNGIVIQISGSARANVYYD